MIDKYDMTNSLVFINLSNDLEARLTLDELIEQVIGWQVGSMENLFKACLTDEDFPGALIIPKELVGLWRWRFDKGLVHISRHEKQIVLDGVMEHFSWLREILEGPLDEEEESTVSEKPSYV